MPIIKNARHELFAQEVAKGSTATAAYRAAGYNVEGPSAEQSASRLSRSVKVAARIAEIQSEAAKAAGLTIQKVLKELALLGFSNMQDYMRGGADGDPYLDFTSLTREQAAALVEVTVEDFKDGRGEDARDVRKVKFKLADKRAALVDIGKHLGMFVDKHDVTHEIGATFGELLKELDGQTRRIPKAS